MRPTALGLLLAMAGCATTGPAGEGEDLFSTSTERPNAVQVIVQNMNFSDARLFAVREGQKTSLGTVGGKQDGRFIMPWYYPQPMQIEIHLLAGPTCLTDSLDVLPGDILELQIRAAFSESSFCR